MTAVQPIQFSDRFFGHGGHRKIRFGRMRLLQAQNAETALSEKRAALLYRVQADGRLSKEKAGRIII